ncbi:MAG: aspartyl protease family protein [Candidatus Zixiibacteriota bacterium]
MKAVLILLCLILMAMAGDSCAVTLDEIMENHIEAMGGFDRIQNIQSSQTVSEIKVAGMEGTSTIYYKHPDKFRSEVQLPMATIIRAADGDDLWMVDLNGQQRRAAGEEAKELVTTLFVASGGYIRKEYRGTAVTYTGDQESEGVSYHKLLIAPDGGLDMTLFIDPETNLIAFSEQTVQMFKVRSWQEDYRDVDGLMVAFRTRQETGVAMLDAEAVTISQEFNVSIDDELFEFQGADRPDFGIYREKFTTVDLEIRSNHIYLPVMIGADGPYNFLLDSGAGMTIIGRDAATSLVLERTGELPAVGVGGVEAGSFVAIDSLSVGQAVMRNLVAGELDLSSINEIAQEPIDGILGYDLFARFVVQIDYYDSLLTLFLPDDSLTYGGRDTLALEIESNHPMVAATINDTILRRFRIDTGSANYLDLGFDVVNQYNLIEESRSTREGMQLRGIGGATVMSVSGRLESFRLGTEILRDVPCSFTTADSGILAIEGVDGNIGGGLLAKFTCTFDYPHGLLFLTPNASIREKDEVVSTGISLRKVDDRIIVDIVLDETPADKNGLKVGDIIIAVNGISVESMELYQANEMLHSDDDAVIELEIERDGIVTRVKLESTPLY